MSAANMETAKKYLKLRQACNHEELLKLVSDGITVESSRDGTHKGLDAFKQYLQNVKPSGDWGEPEPVGNKVLVKGKVKILFVNVGVGSWFTFTHDGNIEHIKAGRL
mmetsp:Transcript_7599/g.21655  ORF Transcript_7599/g.21655 Transcript_7599/m.21655 type:complete len:107 (-) Transcript_7599:2013-2333(-)